MNPVFNEEIMSYYDARAAEYDEIYIGKGPTSIPDPALYRNEAQATGKILSTFGTGHLIDIACGTGYWLTYYARNCSKIALIDQSESSCRNVKGELMSWESERSANLFKAISSKLALKITSLTVPS